MTPNSGGLKLAYRRLDRGVRARGELHLGGDLGHDLFPVAHDVRARAALDRDSVSEAREPVGAEVEELDEIVDLEPASTRNIAEVFGFSVKVGPRVGGDPGGELGLVGHPHGAEEGLLEDRADAPFDLARLDEEPGFPLQQEKAVVCREFELGHGEAALLVEELAWHDVELGQGELLRHHVFDGLRGDPHLHGARGRGHVRATARKHEPLVLRAHSQTICEIV